MAEGVATASTTLARVARLRLFAQAREAAGTGEANLEGDTVGAVLDKAVETFGASFDELLATCRVWVNGEPAERGDPVAASDEVAVLPPVSGGA
jgi:molybdopterin synthase sulfur carrier subunit